MFKNIKINVEITKEKVQIDMQDLNLKGDVLDIGVKNYGIIYKICKQYEDEVAIEYLLDEEKGFIEKEYYDTAVFFFTLSPLATTAKRRRLLKEIYQYIREKGEIILWDINKTAGTFIDLEVEVMMPEDETKIINVSNYNPVKRLSLDQVKKIIEPYFEVTEEKQGKSIFYLRGVRKGREKGKKKDESIIDRIEC